MHNTYCIRPPFKKEEKSVWQICMPGLRRFMDESCHE
jgi:hypothetical protein